ncbi:hypothetical protein [Acidianus manzaensis]|uniref:Archaeal Type IV pilin N-terminal domain-containing protein n=1 Tax=Acidianus manzaensis TaxID=282676 RepID=A0A1W6K2Q1_9CREN|nr:hypothetical protein [Acidianus manzaensis]ARM76821.1 hypothetical protein B6F84_12860 [Acidianus manzaensis]
MENVVSVFLIIVATVLIGLVIFGLSSVYASNQFNSVTIENQAQDISSGLYLQISNNITTGSEESLFIVPQDFNYNGTIYITAFYAPSSLYGSSLVTPQYENPSIQSNININDTSPTPTSATLYFTNLKEMYSGSVTLWKSIVGAPQTITFSNEKGYSPVILFFVQIQGKYIEVGYQWL